MEQDEKRDEKRAADDSQEEMPKEQKKICSDIINGLRKQKFTTNQYQHEFTADI
jgi:hypothetical protein